MRRDRVQLQPTPGRVIAAAQPLEAVTFGLVGQGQPPSWSCRIWCYRSFFSRNRPGAGSLAAPLNHNAMNDSAGGCSAVASHHASWEGSQLACLRTGGLGRPWFNNSRSEAFLQLFARSIGALRCLQVSLGSLPSHTLVPRRASSPSHKSRGAASRRKMSHSSRLFPPVFPAGWSRRR